MSRSWDGLLRVHSKDDRPCASVGAVANILEWRYSLGMAARDGARDEAAARLGQNVRQLRAARGLTQAQIARLAALPRATWANLETGTANPTLAVLDRVARALAVTLEELVQAPRAAVQHYP